MFAYFIGALLCLALIDPACCRFQPDAPDNGRVWRWLLLPWLALAGFSLVRHWRLWSWRSSWWAALLAPWVLALMLAAFTWPYLYAVNALAGSVATTFGGEVIGRSMSGGRSTTYAMRVRDERTGAVVSLRIDKPEYDALRSGDRAVCDYRRGRLGFYFRWRWFAPQGCRFERA